MSEHNPNKAPDSRLKPTVSKQPTASLQDPASPTRRDFLKLAWGALGIAAAGGGGLIGLRFLASQVSDDPFGGEIAAGVVADFPPGTVTPFDGGRFFLVRGEDGGFLALYNKCTHLDCVMLWNESDGLFHCPCHGSTFASDGAVLEPPAPRPLVRFAVTIDAETGAVTVDTSAFIQRQTTSADDWVYPV